MRLRFSHAGELMIVVALIPAACVSSSVKLSSCQTGGVAPQVFINPANL
jgi:hypothetical protein